MSEKMFKNLERFFENLKKLNFIIDSETINFFHNDSIYIYTFDIASIKYKDIYVLHNISKQES